MDEVLDSTHTLIQITVDDLNVNWKIIGLDSQLKTEDPISSNLINSGSYELHFMYSPYWSTLKPTE